jgi:hypothetical protein
MAVRLGVVRGGERSADDIAAVSRSSMDRPLAAPAELWVAVASDDAVLVGAFQRAADFPSDWRLVRRGSGGPEVRLGPGTLHVALAMASPGALVSGDETRIVNRAVRPLLRALTKTGSLAHYFGRDWISVARRPVGWVGFAHDATSQRTLFEAFVGVLTPFATGPRASFLGKPVATLDSLRPRPAGLAQAHRLADAVIEAYVAETSASAVDLAEPELSGATDEGDDPRADPPWTATCEEAIGIVGAGPDVRGRFRIGGDLLVSRDALASLEARVQDAAEPELAHIVDETLARQGVALDGVRSLESIRDVIARARR